MDAVTATRANYSTAAVVAGVGVTPSNRSALPHRSIHGLLGRTNDDGHMEKLRELAMGR